MRCVYSFGAHVQMGRHTQSNAALDEGVGHLPKESTSSYPHGSHVKAEVKE
jgi:hypothetical protein